MRVDQPDRVVHTGSQTRRALLEFNLQIMVSELGALLGAPIGGHVASANHGTTTVISAATVAGAIVGAAIMYLSLRAYHKHREGTLTGVRFVSDMVHFTPAAFLLTLLLYYPTLFFLSRALQANHTVLFSVVCSQLVAFALFLIGINVYWQVLRKYTGREL
jgi:hypothetical protein